MVTETETGVERADQESQRPRRYATQEGARQGRKRYAGAPTRKKCAFCANKTLQVDYKKVSLLQNYVTERGKIGGRRFTGLCAKHQRDVALAIKRARHLALLPYTAEHSRKI